MVLTNERNTDRSREADEKAIWQFRKSRQPSLYFHDAFSSIIFGSNENSNPLGYSVIKASGKRKQGNNQEKQKW